MKLNFSDGFEDERDKRPVYIVNNNVSFSGGVAKFSGSSRLRVPQLSNVDYGNSVMLKIRFRDSNNSSGRPQAIISNADCGNNASILIAKDKDRIIFGAQTENGDYTQIELPKPVGTLYFRGTKNKWSWWGCLLLGPSTITGSLIC